MAVNRYFIIYSDGGLEYVANTYQQLLSFLFVNLLYAGMDDIVEEVADDLGYEYLEQFRQFVNEESELSAVEHQRAFVASTP